jgi:hypothetical protein
MKTENIYKENEYGIAIFKDYENIPKDKDFIVKTIKGTIISENFFFIKVKPEDYGEIKSINKIDLIRFILKEKKVFNNE